VFRHDEPCDPLLAGPRPIHQELLLAATRHASNDARSRGVWHEVVTCLRLTSMALQLEAGGDDPGAQAVAVSYALAASRKGSIGVERLLRREQRHAGPVRYLPPVRRGTSVEHTSIRLAGLLFGAAPTDLELVGAALATHSGALEQWRSTLASRVRNG
jgi:hypothetical protein